MIEIFCFLCMLAVIGYLIVAAGRSAGGKVSALTAPHSGCSVTLSADAHFYELWYMGPGNRIESAWVPRCNVRNTVESLTYEHGVFEVQLICCSRRDGHVRRQEKVRAATLKQLETVIVSRLKEWDAEDGLLFLWNDFYADL